MKGRSDRLAYARKARSAAMPGGSSGVLLEEAVELQGAVEPDSGRGPRLEEVVGRVLRYGSLLSITIMLAGIALTVGSALLGGSSTLSAPMVLSPTPYHDPASLLGGVSVGDPFAVISLGLLVLIATPVIRVASTVVYFLIRRDRVYLAITSFVLLVLIAGFLIGAKG